MIQVIVEQHTEGRLAGKWDISVRDRAEQGEILLFSNQGYENRGDAETIVDRLFGARTDLENMGQIEPVDLLVKRADGTGSHRMIR